jgi:hypothetical protein
MVLGLGGLLAIPKPLEQPRPMFQREVRTGDLPVPCSNQSWPMMDRRCATWTATRPSEEQPQPKQAEVAPKQPQPKVAETKPAAPVQVAKPVEPSPAPAEPAPVKVAQAEPPKDPQTETPAQMVADAHAMLGVPTVIADAFAAAPLPRSATEAVAKESAPEPAADPRPVAERPAGERAAKPRKPEKTREAIEVTVRAGDRSRRTVTIRPTSQQDAMYYAARRNVGAGGPFSAW